MITPSFGLTATERVLPKLALDFTTASLDSRVTFTRTTGASNPATYVNSSGYVTVATNNQPRFDYDPVTLACKGLLIEESRSNLIVYSEDFTQSATWVPVNVSTTAGAATSPDGTTNAVKLAETATIGQHRIYQLSPTLTGTYTYTVYAKKAERKYLVLSESRVTGNRACFDLDAGTVGATAVSPAATITDAGNGYWRCSISAAVTATYFNFTIAPSDTNSVASNPSNSYQGIDGYGIYIWGAQLEAGAFATSYIPTTTAALTRNADVATMTGTNFSDWFNASEGTMVWNFAATSTAAMSTGITIASVSDATYNNRHQHYSVGASLLYRVAKAGVANNINFSGYTASDSTYQTAYTYSDASLLSALNGGSTLSSTQDPPATVTTLYIGAGATGGVSGSMYIKKFRYYPQKFTAAETSAFSKQG